MRGLFGVEIEAPDHIAERGEIRMAYRDLSRARLDLSCAGRGLQQTLLLLSYLTLNPETVILIDEPDAHLEILRQRQIFYFVNGSYLDGAARAAGTPASPPRDALYRNDGGWRFTDVTAAAGVGDEGWGGGAAVADVDNDGGRAGAVSLQEA